MARIKEVWVGIEDPDPTVDRKGIKYLQDSGVDVRMFDRDLQELIRQDNEPFFAEALERAAEVEEEKKPKKISLSTLEYPVASVAIQDFSTEALEQYRTQARIPDAVGSASFNRRFLQQGLLKEEDGRLTPTGFGTILFGKQPRDVLPQAGLLGTIYYANGEQETSDFDGPGLFVLVL